MKSISHREISNRKGLLKIDLVQTNVINSYISTEIDKFIIDILTNFAIYWKNKDDKKDFLKIMQDFMQEYFLDTNKMDNYKIVCDSRINSKHDVDNDIYKLLIEYKQKNSLLITKMFYTIEENYFKFSNEDDYYNYY